MKNEEERKSESVELVPGAEPRGEEGVDARSGSFRRDAQTDASGCRPPLLRGTGGGGSFDGNLSGDGNSSRPVLSQGSNLVGGEILFDRPGESRESEVPSGGSVATGSGGFTVGGGGRGVDRSPPGGGENPSRVGGGGSGIAGGSILVGGGGHGYGSDLSSLGGHAESARSRGRSFISSTPGVRSVRIGSGGASNGRGGGPSPHSSVRGGTAEPSGAVARITSGGGEDDAAASGLLAQAGSNTNATYSGRAVGVESKSAEAQEGTCEQVGENNHTVLTDMNSMVSSSDLPKSPPEEMEILDNDNKGRNMVDLVAGEVQGQQGRRASSRCVPPSGYFAIPCAEMGSVAANLPANNSVSGLGLSLDTNTSLGAAVVLPFGGPEFLGSDEEPPLPMGMIRTNGDVGNSGGSWQPDGTAKPCVEIDLDNARPPPLSRTMEASLELVGIPPAAIVEQIGATLNRIDEEDAPVSPVKIGAEYAAFNELIKTLPDIEDAPIHPSQIATDFDNVDKAMEVPQIVKQEETLHRAQDHLTPAKFERMDAASLQRTRQRVRHQQEEILQQAQGPPRLNGQGASIMELSLERTGEDEEAGLNGREAEPSREDSICERRNEEPQNRVPGIRRGHLVRAPGNRRVHLGIDPMDAAEDGQENSIIGPELHADSTLSTPTIPAERITEAYVVDDDVVVATPLEPVDPPTPAATFIWWKQPNAKRFLALICLVATAPAIALGVYFSTNDPETSPKTVTEVVVSVLASSSPSTSITPTLQPTTSIPTVPPSISPSTLPSVNPSPSPSSSPTECARQIASQVQAIDLQVSDPSKTPEVAVDGKNMVAIVEDSYNSVIYTRFYSLRNDEWSVRDTFLEDHDNNSYPRVALSGKTAFVGFAYANGEEGLVSVYGQNLFGDWDKEEELLLHDVIFDNATKPGANINDNGTSSPTSSMVSPTFYPTFSPTWSLEIPDEFWMNIDGDLACVSDSDRVNLFYRASTQWVQFKRIDAGYATCSIAGETIAMEGQNSDGEYVLLLYKYVPDLGRVVLLQDPISANVARMTLSNDYLVFSTWDDDGDDVFIYRREDAHQEFAFHQQISGSYPGQHIPLFAFDEDILVIGGDSDTRIFLEQDDRWEETLVLDRYYDDYQLSSRTLLATNETGVYSFNIEDCVRPMPSSKPSAAPSPSPSASPSLLKSQSPSSTPSPSSIPSSPPSQSAAPTLAPSESSRPSKSPPPSLAPSTSFPPSTTLTPSLSPTETCFFVEIDILTDFDYEETWWDVSCVTTLDGTQEKKVVYDSSTIEVQMEGETFSAAHIRLTATDMSANGALCDCGDGSGRCNCQGQVCLIKRSDWYWSASDEVFNCEDGGGVGAIIYNNVEEPLWSPKAPGNIIPAAFVSRADGLHLLGNNLGKAVSMTASSSLQFEPETLHSRRVCLPEGDYEFTIYDYAGDSICCGKCPDGHYRVTSNGATIKEGGEFGSVESTPFSIPFLPAPTPA